MRVNYPSSLRLAVLFLLLSMRGMLLAQNALDFDGTNDVVQTNYGGILGAANRTFEAWVNVSPTATANTAILDYGLNAVGSRNTFLVNPNNQLVFISGGTNANISSSVNAVPSGQWAHVAFVMNNSTGFLYVNGIQVGTGSLTTVNTPGGNANMTIGQRVAGGNIPFKGAIDEVRVWSVARSQTEIQSNMNAEFCAIPAGLEAYYQFNEGVAAGTNTGLTSLVDLSGNGYNGTLNNFSLSGTTSNWVTGSGISQGIGTTATLIVSSCGNYVSPSGNYTWNVAGTYADTISNNAGCDSVLTINLSIESPTFGTLMPAVCDSFQAPSGAAVWTSSGMYSDTITNVAGCDSIIAIDLTILSSTASSIGVVSCESYVSPSGSQTWTSTGIYTDVIPNSIGCDSVITVNLTIASSTSETIFLTACDSVVSPSGNYVWFSSGSFLDTLTNTAGCDSVLIVGVQIDNSSSSTLTASACDAYTSPSGNFVWTSSGTYLDTLLQGNDCPEYVTVNLSITDIDTTVTQSGRTLMAQLPGLAFQWLDCSNGYAVIPGATNFDYTPVDPGTFALQITQNGCTDTSGCHTISSGLSISSPFPSNISLYPNPGQEAFMIDIGASYPELSLEVWNLAGQQLYVEHFRHQQTISVSMTNMAKGLYLLRLRTPTYSTVLKWQKE
ncbi:MAG: LamG-like jellyroll fold domain-containing protein [Bacteroidota bacterium]